MRTWLRVALGIAMVGAGLGHLTFLRQTFQVQVPDWVPFSKDFVVLASGVIEILLGLAMIFLRQKKEHVGLILAIFYVLVYPGNIHQYTHQLDGFGLDSNAKRLLRLLMQPLLVALTLYSTNGWKLLKSK